MHEQIHRTTQEQIQRQSTDKSIQTIIICFSPPCTFINDKLAAIRLSGGWVSIIIADESPTHLSQRLISHAWTFVNLKKRHKSIWGDKNWRVNRRKDKTKSVSINLFCFPPPPKHNTDNNSERSLALRMGNAWKQDVGQQDIQTSFHQGTNKALFNTLMQILDIWHIWLMSWKLGRLSLTRLWQPEICLEKRKHSKLSQIYGHWNSKHFSLSGHLCYLRRWTTNR